jgi:glycerophosphoryl diester phosphodiesterase
MARAGYAVWVWTANEPALLARLLADPHVAAVITDDPVGAAALRDRARAADGL